jgi:trigger factor
MGVQFIAVFEVYPEITLPDFTQVSIQRPIASVGDADIDAMIEKLRQQRTHWHPVDRPAIMGDKLSMWMQESILGSEHTPPAQDRELTLGAPTALPAVYDALLGVVAGEAREFTITLPEDHPQAAGKQVHFDIKVKQVAEPHVPDIDEALVQTFGVASGSLETFRSEVRANMERELKQATRKSLKNQVMDTLVQLGHSVLLPQTLVEQEASQLAQDSGLQTLPGQASAQPSIPQALFRERAERRVLLGLMLGQIVAENKIQLDDARLHSTLKTLAASYEHPEDVLRWYYTHPEELRDIQSVALEDQVVDWLLERAQVSEQPLGFFELVQPK